MQFFWGLGLILAVVAAIVSVRFMWRPREAPTHDAPVDLVLDDLDSIPPGPKRRRPEFVDDTAPAVLSVPPELEHPEWDSANWEPPPKRPASQRWLH